MTYNVFRRTLTLCNVQSGLNILSSSYSSLDWVLSHWAHFTVPRFICVHVCVFGLSFHTTYVLYYCNIVGWTWWD